MNNTPNKQLLFVVYDGIKNSVFQSQVLKPLLDRLAEDATLQITLVSFERKKINTYDCKTLIPKHDRLEFISFVRPPFVGKLSLWFSVQKLLRFMKKKSYSSVIARGPLAGLVCIKALEKGKHNLLLLTVQARGLAAEEYRYAHLSRDNFGLKRLWHRYIKNALHSIEHDVYKNKNIIIEAVSPALKKYLIDTFGSGKNYITLASQDIPKKIEKSIVGAFKTDIRRELGICQEAQVYCYSGSYKPWQCADETIEHFACELKKNQNAFLLVLTKDQKEFIEALERQRIPKNAYKVLSVHPDELLQYLSAADVGFMLRKKDIINWVSRPTKMLEYQAVGLEVMHNDTVGWLVTQELGESNFQSPRKSSNDSC